METRHIRLNKATREWVIYAPTRCNRPQDFQQDSQEKRSPIDHFNKCPFCFDNELNLEPIILEMPNKEQNCWQTRIVLNKFPVFYRTHLVYLPITFISKWFQHY
ncbi:MAG: hypothetical protein F6K10_20350 [Moorea sp. SIO2B7]|nr:hypothetical protein [Moorena sp. SIO2B7]